jgi:1,4-dihydroxy-2-naphthoate polyprenyltransferase
VSAAAVEATAAATGIRPGSVRAWVLACRPATLTAAVVPVLVGFAAALPTAMTRHERMPGLPLLAALLGAILLQIVTNLVNDVADHEKGADTAERLGPTRAAQSGLLTPRQMWTGVAVCVALALGIGLYLTAVAGWPIVAIGVASILAGVSYTAGPWPLGYHGLGDLFVFVFFGLVAVCGTGFVELGIVPVLAWFAAVPVGAIATAVLVVNNVRDRATDAVAGKRTLAVRLGRRAGVVEYAVLLLAAYVTPVVVMVLFRRTVLVLLPLLSLPVAARLLYTLATREGRALNACLTGTAKLLLLHGGLFAVGLLYSFSWG